MNNQDKVANYTEELLYRVNRLKIERDECRRAIERLSESPNYMRPRLVIGQVPGDKSGIEIDSVLAKVLFTNRLLQTTFEVNRLEQAIEQTEAIAKSFLEEEE